jgi:hypothetical protein
LQTITIVDFSGYKLAEFVRVASPRRVLLSSRVDSEQIPKEESGDDGDSIAETCASRKSGVPTAVSPLPALTIPRRQKCPSYCQPI